MNSSFKIIKNSGYIDIKFSGFHNLFPYYEIVVQREEGSRQVVYKYDAKAEGGYDGPGLYNLNMPKFFEGKATIQNVK